VEKATKYLYVGLALAYLLLIFFLARPSDLFYLVSTVILFAMPGIFLGYVLFGGISLQRPHGLIFGAVLGIAFSEFIVLAAAYLFGWRPFLLLLVVLFFLIGSYFLSRMRGTRESLLPADDWRPADYKILWMALALLLLFVSWPFLNFGKLTSFGYAFTWLFGFDFILRSSYSAALTLGMPPDFTHLTGNTFHYYLLSHTPSALAYTLGRRTGSLPSILLLYTLLVDVLFIAAMFALLHRFIKRVPALACTTFVMMAGYSYYWCYAVVHWSVLNSEYARQFTLLGKLPSYGDVSHLFQRLFLVEPQAVTSLCLLIAVLYFLEQISYRLIRYDLAVLVGLCLGVGFGIDALLGLVAALWFGLAFLCRWLWDRDRIAQEIGPVIVATLTCSLTYMSFFALGMYSFSDGGQMHLEIYPWIIRNAPVYFLIEFGPMLLLGLLGIVLALRARVERISFPILLLGLLVILLVVFLRVGVLPRERLAERLLPITALISTGFFFDYLFRENRHRWFKLAALSIVILAVPTFGTDIYFTSAVNDPSRTGYVRAADMHAVNWIRQTLPPRAIVQSEPNYFRACDTGQPPSVAAISLIPDFAERREVVGEWYVAGTTLVNSKPEETKRAHDITRMFSSTTPDQVLLISSKYGIEYIYIGACEQEMYPAILNVLKADPANFRPIYERDGVHIFQSLSSTKEKNVGAALQPLH
jgi:hypothetical protein